MKHYPEEFPEFGLTKEHILAARAADSGPNAPKPAARTIKRAGEKSTLHLHVLGSGSKGNCAVIEGATGSVMVDCGFSKKATLARMELAGIDPSSICAIILTHEHTDHISGVDVVSRHLKVPVYASRGTIDAKQALQKIANLESFSAHDELRLGGIDITLFSTSHDAAEPVGMRFGYGDDAIGYATDTGILTEEGFELLTDCHVLALESNHDPEMLRTGPYPHYLKERIAGKMGHLSNGQCRENLEKLLCNNLECVVGMHLSETNNMPNLALASLRETVGDFNHPATVAVAAQQRPISVI